MNPQYHLTRIAFAVVATAALVSAGCSSQPSSGRNAPSPGAPEQVRSAETESHTDRDPSNTHDPDDVPITEQDIEMPTDYAALVARAEQLAGEIRDRIAASAPTKAHRSLDELEIILKKAPEIAAKNVAKEFWKEVNLQSKELAAAHNELHEKIDEKQIPDYPAVAERIQKALAALKAIPAN